MPHISANGISIYYELKGNPQGETLVFVNGLLTDTASWNNHLPFFADRYRCLVYDCRGQGQSDKPDHVYETPLHTADLAALLDALDVERAHFIGLSNGGAAALAYAARHPERVLSVSVAGAYPYVDTLLRVKLASWVRAMEFGGSPLRFDVSSPWIWGGNFLEKNYEGLLPFREKGTSMPIEWAMNLVKGAMVHDIREKLALITAPVFVVVGEEDVLTPPKLAEYIAERVPNSQMHVMLGLGHAAALEDIPAFCVLVAEFLDSLKVGAS